MSTNLRREITGSLGISDLQINRIITRSPYAYKTYSINKKSGGKRIISQPAKETKFIQRWLVENVFSKLPIHQSVTAYRAGSSIKKNASIHKNNKYFAKFDFKDFFTSIRSDDLIAHLNKYLSDKYSYEEIMDIARISCKKNKRSGKLFLTIGAPSSPIISNTVLFDFDTLLYSWCCQNNITYTRYADDLTFSTNEKESTKNIEKNIRSIIRAIEYPRLIINSKKTVHLSKKSQIRITGLIIDNNKNVSIGRKRKREISSLIHSFSLGALPNDEVYRLQGLLGFANDSEPQFLERMRSKYSSEKIDNILKIRKQ
ncbi:retron St85 family RNA-directed DNA polymerase [Methylomonas sp. 11b]|uniref:retron St85 family RNA-directed DNA polymerase n=1 Tax=Methylomonas sp. 11b TaxID=1168169 RepID=UPI000479A91D|nr:retron St85 family RNA-directed DNA polymerase [Methylomonas sp. 11b]